MKTFCIVFLSAAAAAYLGCSKNSTNPGDDFKDPRQYTWTVDTLAYPGSFQTTMRDMWGSSPKDVYVVGHNDQNRGLMYHFNGLTWQDVRLSTVQGGMISGPIDLSAIYGFASNDIWAVGEHIYQNPNPPPNFLDSSLVIHFDGTKWTEVKVPRFTRLLGVWGSLPTNVYAVGNEGIVLHYDGIKWSTQFLSPPAQLLYLGGDLDRLFAGGGLFAGGLDTEVVFTNSGSGWQLLDSQNLGDSRFGASDFYSPTLGVYYCVGLGIFRWQGTAWEKVLPSDVFLNHIYGSSADNIFATGQFGRAYHWNGSDWAVLNLPSDKIPSDVWLTGVWTDGREAFLCGFGHLNSGATVTFILHGK